MQRWRRKYRGWVRRMRKRHPLRGWVHGIWLVGLGLLIGYYYRLFDLVENRLGPMAYFIGLQLVYFYLLVFVGLPWAYHARNVLRSVVLHIVCLLAVFVFFAGIMISVSIATGKLELDLDFSKPFQAEILNFGEMVFVYMALAPFNALLFFYVERYLIKKRKNRRLWLWFHDAQANLVLSNHEWLSWQMEPHLMGNLVTALRGAARSGAPEKLVKATTYVGNLMQFYTQMAKSNAAIALRHEVSQAKLLLAVHRLAETRGGAAKHVSISIGQGVPDVVVLPMTVLVLVENSIQHATRIDRRHPASVTITRVSGGVKILAENAYDPHADPPVSHRGNGVALKNIAQRLKAVHAGSTLERIVENGKFCVVIFIPDHSLVLTQSQPHPSSF